jgi:hypothetical protein
MDEAQEGPAITAGTAGNPNWPHRAPVLAAG